MADGPSEVGSGDSSRSEFHRFLLAVSFATLLATGAAHVASYSGFLLIQSRIIQNLLTSVLIALAVWKVLPSTMTNIPRVWSVAMRVVWWYAIILPQFSPIMGRSYMWPRTTRWLGLDWADLRLVSARTSSAFQVASALSLFVWLWYRPSAAWHYAELLGRVLPSRRMRALGIFGIALPLAIIAVCSVLPGRNDQDLGLVGWVAIVAVFWLIGGMVITGIDILRDAIQRDA